jgi:hypothetical protein
MIVRTNILQIIKETPKRKNGFIHRFNLLVWISILAAMFVGINVIQAQTLQNGGVIINTGSSKVYGEVQNYKNGVAGKIWNSGTLNITKSTGTGNLINDDGSGTTGTVLNYIGGTGAGTIICSGTTGNYSNGGGVTRNDSIIYVGTIQLLGSLTNTGTFDTQTGKVEFNGTSAQTIPSGVVNSTYGILAASTSGVKSLSGATIVNNSVQISGTASVNVAGNTLTLNGSNPFPSGGTLTANTTNSAVIYNASGAQTVHTATYYKLTIQNGGTKTASGNITVNNLLTNTATFDLSTNSFTTGASASITNSGTTIQTSGNVTFGATHTIGGTFIYQATSAQSVGTANYSDLTLQNSGQKNFPTGTVGVSNVYSVSGGNRSYGTGTFVYNGGNGVTQTIAAGDYATLLLVNGSGSGTADKLIDNDVTVQTTGGLDVAADVRLTLGNTGSTLNVGTSGTGDFTMTGPVINNGTINVGN